MSGNGDDKSPGANNVWHCQHLVAGSHQTPIIPGTASAERQEALQCQESLAVPALSGFCRKSLAVPALSGANPPNGKNPWLCQF